MMAQVDSCQSRCSSCYATDSCPCHCHDNFRTKPVAINWAAIMARVDALCVPCTNGFQCKAHKPDSYDERDRAPYEVPTTKEEKQ
jgi:hypothetical protein